MRPLPRAAVATILLLLAPLAVAETYYSDRFDEGLNTDIWVKGSKPGGGSIAWGTGSSGIGTKELVVRGSEHRHGLMGLRLDMTTNTLTFHAYRLGESATWGHFLGVTAAPSVTAESDYSQSWLYPLNPHLSATRAHCFAVHESLDGRAFVYKDGQLLADGYVGGYGGYAYLASAHQGYAMAVDDVRHESGLATWCDHHAGPDSAVTLSGRAERALTTTLGWTSPASSDRVLGYRVYESSAEGERRHDVGCCTVTLPREPGLTYAYRVTYRTAYGESPLSNEVALGSAGGALLPRTIVGGHSSDVAPLPAEAGGAVVVRVRDSPNGALLCVTLAIAGGAESELACVARALLGGADATIPRAEHALLPPGAADGAGASAALSVRYAYVPQEFVTVATAAGRPVILPFGNADFAQRWGAESVLRLTWEATTETGTERSSLDVPVLGQVVGAARAMAGEA